jgi:hypothetical protein
LRHEYISREGENYFVTTNEGQKLVVKLGLQNEEGAEILDGVAEGTTVKKVDFTQTKNL